MSESRSEPVNSAPREAERPSTPDLNKNLSQGRDPAVYGLLALACLLGLLRFWRLGEWSLWIDEAYTYADGHTGLWAGNVWNPLGYQLILWTVDLVGGRADEFSMRLLPAIAGWLCIPLSFWAFREVVGGRRAGLLALLIAVSSWQVYWSQNARFYTFAMAVSLLGAGIVLRGLWRGRASLTVSGTLVVVMGTAFHVTASLVVPALLCAPLLIRLRSAKAPPGLWRAWRAMAAIVVLGGLVATPWLMTAMDQHTREKGTFDLLRGPLHLLLTSGYFYTPLVGIAAVCGAIWSWRTRDIAGLFAVGASLAGMGSVLLISTQVLMTAQYTFCFLPWVLLVAVAPLEALGSCRIGRSVFWTGACVLAAPALAGTLLLLTSRQGERPRWRDAYNFVDRSREAGDMILGMGAPIGEFYLGADGADPKRMRTVSPLADWYPDGPRRWTRHDRTIWVVVRPQWMDSLQPDDRLMLQGWLASDCQLVKTFPVLMEGRDLELQVYRRDS